MDHDETGRLVAESNSDPMARMVFTLTDALHHQAALADTGTVTAKLIGKSLLLALHAFTDADDQDTLLLLRAPRSDVLRAGQATPGARPAGFPARRRLGRVDEYEHREAVEARGRGGGSRRWWVPGRSPRTVRSSTGSISPSSTTAPAPRRSALTCGIRTAALRTAQTAGTWHPAPGEAALAADLARPLCATCVFQSTVIAQVVRCVSSEGFTTCF